jgi:serine acetyltransferase
MRCAQHYTGARAAIARRLMRREGRRWGYDIHLDARIGPGLYLTGHPGGIVVAPGVIAGRNLTLRHGVTIGETGRGEVPRLGDGVYVAAGAKILGPITIGSNVAVGANAVVTKDVPDDAIVAGVPAKVISFDGASSVMYGPPKYRVTDPDGNVLAERDDLVSAERYALYASPARKMAVSVVDPSDELVRVVSFTPAS